VVFKLRQQDPTRIQRVKVEHALKDVREEFSRDRHAALAGLRHRVIAVFRRIFSRLGTRNFRFRRKHKNHVPLVEDYNRDLRDISMDLTALYEETKSLRGLQQEVFNYNQVLTEDLVNRAAKGASQVIDLRLLAGQLQEDLVVAGDDFNDHTRIDSGFTLDNPAAEVVTSQGIVTLQRTETEQILDEDTDVIVRPLNQGVTREPTGRNLQRFYEGNFYNYVGKARPEGGAFNLEETVPETVPTEGVDYTILDIPSQHLNVTDLFEGTASEGDRNEFNDLREEGSQTQASDPLRPEDVVVRDLGASEEDRIKARRTIVDNNPDTTWECEYVQRVWDAEVGRFPAPDEVNVGGEEGPGFFGIPDFYFRDESEYAEYLRGPGDRNFDLEVEIVLRLRRGQQKLANFISLNPMNFGERAWLEVFDVSTAETDSSAFVPIEGFDQGLFANTLTDEANEELTEGDYKATLAPTKYAYKGQGIWTFSTRKVNSMRFKLRQKVPVPSPYQRMHVQLRRTITRSIGTASVIRESTKVVKLSYLQTVQAMDDVNFRNEAAGTTIGGSSSGTQSNTTSAKWYYYAFLGLFGGGGKSSTVSTSHSDTGWQVTRNWLETYWDLIRYAVGIRDIGLFSYIFTSTSEVVSVPFTSPKDVMKVQVRVDDYIPAALSPEQQWIKYYISIDNGQEWLRINPLDRPTVYDDDGEILPYTYTFNAEVEGPQGDTNRVVNTPTPVRRVRFRAVLSGNTEIEDGNRITPVLKSYRVLMTPRGGLSDAGI
jgi:hypothetical protein